MGNTRDRAGVQRRRALANVGKPPRRLPRAAPVAASMDSHSHGGAANSENSALASASSATEGSRPEAVPSTARSPTASRPEAVPSTARSASGGSRPEGPRSPTASTDLSGYGWYEEYVELTQRYRWQVAAYMAWAASPVVGRQPATQMALAQAIGLRTDRTIRQWKEKDATIDAVIKELQAAPLWRHRRDLYEALVRTAVAGDVPALKLALEMTGDYVPRMKQTVEAQVKAVAFTADEMAQAERELGEWERGRQWDSKTVGQKSEGKSDRGRG